MPEPCSWCAATVPDDDGFRLGEPEAGRRAVFCRLEHVVPWAMRGGAWTPGAVTAPGEPDDALGRCAHCGDALGAARVLLVRHRSEHRIADAFCTLQHAEAWAKAGGRWQAA